MQRNISQPAAIALSETAITAEAAAGIAGLEAMLAAEAAVATGAGLGLSKIFGTIALVVGGGLILGGDTPQPEPEPPVVLSPIVTEPEPSGSEPDPEPKLEPATGGAGAQDGGGPCDFDEPFVLAEKGEGDIDFDSRRQAIREALRQNNVSTSQPNAYTIREMYGQNPNLVGPQGQPWYQIDAVDLDGNPVTIDVHSNGHVFRDISPAEVRGPHVQGLNGEHFGYPQGC